MDIGMESSFLVLGANNVMAELQEIEWDDCKWTYVNKPLIQVGQSFLKRHLRRGDIVSLTFEFNTSLEELINEDELCEFEEENDRVNKANRMMGKLFKNKPREEVIK